MKKEKQQKTELLETAKNKDENQSKASFFKNINIPTPQTSQLQLWW